MSGSRDMILVLTTPRTGSTWYCKYLAEKYGALNYDEPFNINHKGSHLKHLRSITANTNCIVKLMPNQIEGADVKNLFSKLKAQASEIHVLVRKDFDAQMRSHYAAEYLSGMYGVGWTTEFHEPREVYYDEDRYRSSQAMLLLHIRALFSMYTTLIKPKLIFTEDLPSKYKYNRPIIWSSEPLRTRLNPGQAFKEYNHDE